MLRPADLSHFLVTIRNALAEDLRPDLKSDHIRAEAGALLLMLDRLITELSKGDAIAAESLERWNGVRQQMEALGLGRPESGGNGSPAGFVGSLEALVAGMDEVQERLSERKNFDAFAARLAADDPRARKWLEQAVATLVELTDASEPIPARAAPKQSATGGADDAAFLRPRLNAYLHARYPGLPPEPITQLRIVPGGHCKQTSLFTIVPNELLPQRLVLRRDLAMSITGTKVTDEFPVMERVFKLGLPVPEPVLIESDASVLNGSFMVMAEVTDAAICGTYFPEERRGAPRIIGPDFGKEVAQLLARLHSGTRTAGDTSAEQMQLAQQHYDAWHNLVDKPPASVSVDLGLAWMLSHPLSNRPRCLVHGDVGAHNMMVRDGHLASMLDWELAKEGDPAEDLAQCRMMLLPDVMPWEAFVREYIAAGGDPLACDAASVAWFCIWTYVKHGLMNGTLRAAYLAGKRDDVIAGVVSSHYVQRLMDYQAKTLQIALEVSPTSTAKTAEPRAARRQPAARRAAK